MNNSYQAKNGLKTFIFVFIFSLGLFSLFYYFTSYPTTEFDIETHSESKPVEKEVVLGENTEKSVFKDVAQKPMNVKPRTVLAGATSETTESTVPTTGTTGMTLALIGALLAITAGIYIVHVGPRKLALAHFEKSLTKKLRG